jgi:transposase InsO family protein
MHNLETALGFGASEKARFKLHVIELLADVGWRGVKKAFPHLSKATTYRWRQQFVASGRRLNALVPHSTRPKTVRQMEVPIGVLSFLKAMRRQHPHLSKYKLKVFLDEFCQVHGLPFYSVSWIGKVLSRYQLFFETRKPVRKRRKKSRSGYTIRRTPNPDKVMLGYLELDGTTVYWGGDKLVFLTALELKTRTAWAKLVPSASSFHARAFLLEILDTLPYSLHTIHTDNGSEFHALFDQVVQELHLTHLWSPPRTPKVHSHIERFNGVIQDEFINYHVDEAVLDTKAFVSRLNEWLHWYNQKRPHHSLNLKSPAQYYQYLLDLEKGDESLKSL